MDYQGDLGITCPSLKWSCILMLSQGIRSLSMKCTLTILTIILCVTLVVVIVAGCAGRPRL